MSSEDPQIQRPSHFYALVATFLVVALLFMSLPTAVAKDDRKCEVCAKVLQKISDGTPSEKRSDMDALEKTTRKLCKDLKLKEHKFCFYIGALPESATSIMRDVVKPLSWGMPTMKVCEKLDAMDSQICELKYDKDIDWKTVDISKMRVKELKKILDGWGEQCRACTEKTEYVDRVKELKPKYVKEEL